MSSAAVRQVIALAAELSEEERRVVVDAIAPQESVAGLAAEWEAEIARRAERVRTSSRAERADARRDRVLARAGVRVDAPTDSPEGTVVELAVVRLCHHGCVVFRQRDDHGRCGPALEHRSLRAAPSSSSNAALMVGWTGEAFLLARARGLPVGHLGRLLP